ncbi:MAG: hemerythrin domain-containing protein [Chloroflexi bacterium]|nr:hemerythrin domain-containing protein [Chloroflexota bacterium]
MSGGLTNFRYVHKGILRELAMLEAKAQALSETDLAEQAASFRRAARFSEAVIKNHAYGEEKVIFPAVREIFRKALPPGINKIPRLTRDVDQAGETFQAFVEADHRFAEALAARLAEGAVRLGQATDPGERALLITTCRQQASAVHAVLALHFQKENNLLLPLAEARLSIEEQDALMRQVEAALPISGDRRADSIKRWWQALGPEEKADYRSNLMRMDRWPGDAYVEGHA